VTGRWTGCGLCLTGRVRSAFSVCACFSLMIERAARPVTIDRTRPVVEGAYWTLTGRWHCRVRSLPGARSVVAWSASDRCFAGLRYCAIGASGQLRDQRVWSFAARPVCASSASSRCFAVSRCATGVSGQLDQRVWSVLRDLAVVRPARPVSWISASDQHDFGCLSF
jgi:hypothetical protein